MLPFIRFIINSLISLTISLYTSWGLYCEIYYLLEDNTEEFKGGATLQLSWTTKPNLCALTSLFK